MQAEQITRGTVILALIVALTMPAAWVGAQQATPAPVGVPQIEFVGLIEAASANSLTVNGSVIDITGAEINVPLTIGAPVKIEGTLGLNGQVIAREVQSPEDEGYDDVRPGEVEVVGLLTALSGTSYTIGTQVIDGSLAEIGPGVAIGQVVKAHVLLSPSNTWVAREIELTNDGTADDRPGDDDSVSDGVLSGAEFEFTGTLTEQSGDSIVVGRQRVVITGAEIKTPLIIGALVKVHASFVNGQLVAREVELAGNDDGDRRDGETEIVGVLSAINGTSYLIGGQLIDGSTAEIGPGVAVGQIIKAHVTPGANGTWVAREIELDDDDSRSDGVRTGAEFEFTGTLTEQTTDSIVVGGQRIIITNAEINGPLIIGDVVKVHASLVNGQLVAREVESESRDDDSSGRGSDDSAGLDDRSGGRGSDDSPGDDSSGGGDDNSGDDSSGRGGDDNSGGGGDDNGGDDDDGGGDD